MIEDAIYELMEELEGAAIQAGSSRYNDFCNPSAKYDWKALQDARVAMKAAIHQLCISWATNTKERSTCLKSSKNPRKLH